jgi:hypothetical protein
MGSFSQLVHGVLGYLGNASDDTAVWFDIVAVNQHADSPQNKQDVASFEATLKACTAGTIVVVDMSLCSPATRGWCKLSHLR